MNTPSRIHALVMVERARAAGVAILDRTPLRTDYREERQARRSPGSPDSVKRRSSGASPNTAMTAGSAALATTPS